MLITFSCKVSGNVTMFGDIAKQLLKMMGFCEAVPGAIDAEDVPSALANLKQAIDEAKQRQRQEMQDGTEAAKREKDELDDADYEPEISIAIRAIPLIEMLQAAEKEQCYIMWE
ncbi:DUF1840 domain-containing protein [Photobacterium lipolyticum]|uniref:DUF1840 domain-containing protein n=1 Tax=Photobacterium lipolyticum TaxID=266810 RepID=A0A2T3N2P5_9GAMM|nr:DUF1840 domain-containing protein [Photobacterium lipolyticum]PSW06642.1 DUF1840 domain-containing protein [Photobacterium lipolyticum]